MSIEDHTVEYREVPGFPGYRVGDDGSVWSCRPINGVGPFETKWRKLKPTMDKKGWLVVSIQGGTRKKKRQTFVHRLVLLAFVGPCPPGQMSRHFPDPDPTNNRLSNLQWGTRKQNAADAILHGAQIRGEQCFHSKLNPSQVIAIRKEYATGTTTFASLGRKFGIAQGNIAAIIYRRTWKHV